MNLFESKLDKILSDYVLLSENIEKKWPYVYRALKDVLVDAASYPTYARRELLSGYALTVRREIENDRQKTLAIRQKFPEYQGIYKTGTLNRNIAYTEDFFSKIAADAKDAGLPRELRPPTRLEYIAEYFKKWLVEADPVAQASKGRKTPFVNHIVRWLISTKAVFPDDIRRLNEMLKEYVKLKNNLGADIPDLEDVDDPNVLRSQIMEYAESDAYKKLEDKKLPSIVPGIEAYRIDTFDEGRDILCDSGWCVADEEAFESYTPPFYVFVRKAGDRSKRLALFNVYSGELKDVYNADLPPETISKIAPILDHILSNTDIDPDKLSSNYDLLYLLAHNIHLLPETSSKLSPSALADMAQMTWGEGYGYPRWPDYMEKRLQKDPKSFMRYVNAVSQHNRVPELEDDLIELAYVYFDRDFEYIVMLLEYFGERDDEFNNGWPELSELLDEIVKYDLQDKFMKDMRYANRDGIRGFMILTGGKWDLEGVDKGPRWPKSDINR